MAPQTRTRGEVMGKSQFYFEQNWEGKGLKGLRMEDEKKGEENRWRCACASLMAGLAQAGEQRQSGRESPRTQQLLRLLVPSSSRWSGQPAPQSSLLGTASDRIPFRHVTARQLSWLGAGALTGCLCAEVPQELVRSLSRDQTTAFQFFKAQCMGVDAVVMQENV